MPFCPKCGREENRVDANFCNSCGYRLAGDIGFSNARKDPMDTKHIVGVALAVALMFVGIILIGGRALIFAASPASVTAPPQYYALSYLLPFFMFTTIPYGIMVFLGVRHDRRARKSTKTTKRNALGLWIVFGAIIYLAWLYSALSLSLGLYLLSIDTGIITIPLALAVYISTKTLIWRSGSWPSKY